MNLRFRHILAVLLAFACLLTVFSPLTVQAAQTEETGSSGAEEQMAEDISSRKIVKASKGIRDLSLLFDGDVTNDRYIFANATMTLEHDKGIGSVYMCFGSLGSGCSFTDNTTGESVTPEIGAFLHQFVDLTELFGYAPTSVTINFGSKEFKFSEIQVFTEGQVPDTVQKWKEPADGKTDLLLLSAHGDDEQLFFAGILPYYAGELGYQVQVVYLTDHHNYQPFRLHEMLNGLWSVGVDVHPVIGTFSDFLGEKWNMELAYMDYRGHGETREELLGFVVEQVRRFKPQVIVTHDFNGEYGHPQHMVCADLMAEAVTVSNDASVYPELAEQYGLWDPPKAYFHLYEENQIVMEWNQPLERFGGMTAYEVTRDLGFPCHASQVKDFAWYFREAPTALDVVKYNPCYYGLYRSTVGPDVQKNDFFENVLTYDQQVQKAEEERLAAEEAARLEEERKAAEEAARIEAERKAAEEAARLEEERKAAEEAARIEAERKAVEEAARQKRNKILAICAGCAAAVLAVLALIFRRRGHGRFEKKQSRKK